MEITYKLSRDSTGGVLVDAKSNLPDGSEMNASFYVEDGYYASDSKVLEEGKASFGPFSDKGTPLKGTYDLSITLPIARNQPKSVQACIGEVGELMTGPLVSKEAVTGDNVASLDDVVKLG